MTVGYLSAFVVMKTSLVFPVPAHLLKPLLEIKQNHLTLSNECQLIIHWIAFLITCRRK